MIIKSLGFGILVGSILTLCIIIPIAGLYKLTTFMWSFLGFSPIASIWISLMLVTGLGYYILFKD